MFACLALVVIENRKYFEAVHSFSLYTNYYYHTVVAPTYELSRKNLDVIAYRKTVML